jgi:hypothetical protein
MGATSPSGPATVSPVQRQGLRRSGPSRKLPPVRQPSRTVSELSSEAPGFPRRLAMTSTFAIPHVYHLADISTSTGRTTHVMRGTVCLCLFCRVLLPVRTDHSSTRRMTRLIRYRCFHSSESLRLLQAHMSNRQAVSVAQNVVVLFYRPTLRALSQYASAKRLLLLLGSFL